MNKTVFLVNLPLSELSTTPFFVMPTGLLSIAAYLRNKGENVELMDLNVAKRNLPGVDLKSIFKEKIKHVQPIILGISVMVAGQFKMAKDLCKEAKAVLPGIITVVGGAHVSQFPNEILSNCPEVDFVVMGEGEIQAWALVQYARKMRIKYDWPDGIAFRSTDNGSRVVLRKFNYISDVDRLPWPAYDMVNFDDYRHDTSTWHNPFQIDLSIRIPVITSRGCPNVCNFCSVAKCMGLKHRAMGAEHVVDMFEMLSEKHGAGYFAIFDANFAEDPGRVIQICKEIIRRKLKIALDLPTGLPINAAAPAMIDALAEAGLIRTCISIETGDEFIRNNVMLKKVEQNEIFNIISAIRCYPQIFLLVDFVIGMPEDTKSSLENSRRIIDELDVDDIAISIATPYPGTKLYEQCKNDGLFLPGIDYNNLYEAEWYSHSNLDKFIIKPYNLDIQTLCNYKNMFLEMRSSKLFLYRKRMQTFIGN